MRAYGRRNSAGLQAHIDALRQRGGGTLECVEGATYVCDEPLNLDDLRHVTIDGARSEWVFTGAAGDFVSLKSSVQCALRDLRVRAAHPSYGGHLVTTGWGAVPRDPSHLLFEDCEFVSDGPARAALRLDRAIFVTVRHCQFQGANFGILGIDGSYSNVVAVRDCAFYSLRQAAIFNAGEAWTIETNGFEPLVSGAACAYSQDIATVAKGLAFTGNWCGDITTPGGAWLAVRASGLRVAGNYFGSPGGPSDPCLRLFACRGVVVQGNHNQTTSVFAEFAPDAGLSHGVTLSGNDLGIGAVRNPQFCTGLRLVNNVGQADV